jgi:hypothetical protein
MFVVTPTDYWGDLPVPAVVGGALFLGLIWGAYLSINARRDARRTERGGDQPEEVEDPGGQASPPTTTAESVVRHYLGYVVALAMGLFVAAAVKDRTIAAMAMFVAFVLSKFAIDMLLPSVRPAVVKGKMRLMHVIVAIPFGVLAWGLPLGAFVVALALTLEPSMSLVHLTTLFALTLIIVGIGSALAVATAWFMNLVPEDSLPAREQGDV